jgi:hypothetical protein
MSEDRRDAIVERALAGDRAELPCPLWPLVRDRIARRSRRPSPRARLAFGLGAATAAAAGLMVGATLGTNLDRARDADLQATWSEVGSLIADGGAATLDDMYFSVTIDEGDEGP